MHYKVKHGVTASSMKNLVRPWNLYFKRNKVQNTIELVLDKKDRDFDKRPGFESTAAIFMAAFFSKPRLLPKFQNHRLYVAYYCLNNTHLNTNTQIKSLF